MTGKGIASDALPSATQRSNVRSSIYDLRSHLAVNMCDLLAVGQLGHDEAPAKARIHPDVLRHDEHLHSGQKRALGEVSNLLTHQRSIAVCRLVQD